MTWPTSGGAVVICAYTQGGAPKPDQFTAVFTKIGKMVGSKLA
jgi:beta-lactamase class A